MFATIRAFVGCPVLLLCLLLFPLTRGSDSALHKIIGGNPTDGQEYPFFVSSSVRILAKHNLRRNATETLSSR
jgi:secreted trypsin-like serine protease